MKKPVDAKLHGIIDYAFAGVQLFGPSVLGLNKNFVNTYRVLGTAFTGVNAVTNTPVGLTNTLSMKSHQKADATFLATLATMTFSHLIKDQKKALAFHLGFLGLALVNYALTDYSNENVTESL